jgi:predicted nucleic acid-binding protein
MILIDTSAWIEFFRRRGDVAVKSRVAGMVETGDAAFCGPVLYELLLGARPTEAPLIRQALGFCRLLDFPVAAWELGAALEKSMRQKGIAIPRDDILVAATALHNDVPLYSTDKHFQTIAEYSASKLRLV